MSFVCISCFSCSAGKKSFTKLHLILIPSFPNISQYDLTSATFNELKNYNSSSLIPSLLFVFEVKVDYVEGNSRMIIYNNYVEVPQLCMAKKRSAHVLECLLNNARSRSTSTQTKVRVKRFVHVVLHVDVLDQLLLLGEAPHTVCALPQLSFWPCWLSFIRILRWSSNNCQSWINCEIGRIQIRD